MPGAHDGWSGDARGGLGAKRHDHLSVAASACVDTAAAYMAAASSSGVMSVTMQSEQEACARKHVCIVQAGTNALRSHRGHHKVWIYFTLYVCRVGTPLEICIAVLYCGCSLSHRASIYN